MNPFKHSEVCSCRYNNVHFALCFHSFFCVLKSTEAFIPILFQPISPLHTPVCVCESATTQLRRYVKPEQSKNAVSWGRRLSYLREQSLIQQSAQANNHLSNKLAGLVGGTSLTKLATTEWTRLNWNWTAGLHWQPAIYIIPGKMIRRGGAAKPLPSGSKNKIKQTKIHRHCIYLKSKEAL